MVAQSTKRTLILYDERRTWLELAHQKLDTSSRPTTGTPRGPVIIFVSRPQGTSFAALLGHAALEQDGEVVERLFPVVNRHGPLA